MIGAHALGLFGLATGLPYVVPTGTSSLVPTFPVTGTFNKVAVISGSVLNVFPKVYTSYLLGINAAFVVIEPEIKLLEPPKIEVASTDDGMATH